MQRRHQRAGTDLLDAGARYLALDSRVWAVRRKLATPGNDLDVWGKSSVRGYARLQQSTKTVRSNEGPGRNCRHPARVARYDHWRLGGLLLLRLADS